MVELKLTAQEADDLQQILTSFARHMATIDFVPKARKWANRAASIEHKLIDATTPPPKK